MNLFSRKNIFRVSVVSSIITLCGGFALVYNYFNMRDGVIIPAQEEALKQTIALSEKIHNTLNQSIPVATALSEDLFSQEGTTSDLIKRLKQVLSSNPKLIGVGLAYEPFAYDSDVRLFAPYLMRRDKDVKEVQLENQVDYTLETYDWYHQPLKNGAQWNEPRFSQAAERNVIEYALPFFQKDPETGQKQKMGIVAYFTGSRHVISHEADTRFHSKSAPDFSAIPAVF